MDREQAKQEIKSRYAEYLRPAKKRVNGKQTFICPLCNNGTGKDGDGLAINPKAASSYSLKCFKCGFSGDIIDLYQQEHNCDTAEAFNALYDRFNITIDKPESRDYMSEYKKTDDTQKAQEPQQTQPEPAADFTGYFKSCREQIEQPEAQAYLQQRGISKATADTYFIGYDSSKKRLIIPAAKSFYLARDITGTSPIKYENAKGASVALFNAKALYTDKTHYTYITEGVFDALAFIEAGAEAVALNSTSNTGLLLKALEEQPTSKTLLLCLDNDTAGQTKQAELVKELQQRHIDYRECSELVKPYKDAGEAIEKDRAAFTRAVSADMRRADKPDNAADYIQRELAAAIAEFKSGGDRQTGFKQLDFAAGGVYNGLYVIGGISSVGKTTFTHQLADQLAAQGSHVLYFSLEQSRLEMICKSIARGTAKIDEQSAATSLQIRKGKQSETIAKATADYTETIAERMSIIEGNFNCTASFIRDYAARYIERNNTRPVIVIDYLQIMQPETDPETHRKPTDPRIIADYNVTALKRITRELDLPVFVISSVNRSNYLTEIDFESFKESGGIEYTADVVWGLQLQAIHKDIFSQANKINEKRQEIKRAKAEIPRKIELVCLKNRYGEPSYSVQFEYKPQYDYFTEEVILSPWEQEEINRRAAEATKRY